MSQALASAVTEQRISKHVRRNHFENFVQYIALNLQIFCKSDKENYYRGDRENQKVEKHSESLRGTVRRKYE